MQDRKRDTQMFGHCKGSENVHENNSKSVEYSTGVKLKLS